MNTVMKMEMIEVAAPIPAPYMPPMMNIKAISTMMTICPARMLANRRIIRANGLVRVDTSSMMGIKGMGNFRNNGTSGQRISFQ